MLLPFHPSSQYYKTLSETKGWSDAEEVRRAEQRRYIVERQTEIVRGALGGRLPAFKHVQKNDRRPPTDEDKDNCLLCGSTALVDERGHCALCVSPVARQVRILLKRMDRQANLLVENAKRRQYRPKKRGREIHRFTSGCYYEIIKYLNHAAERLKADESADLADDQYFELLEYLATNLDIPPTDDEYKEDRERHSRFAGFEKKYLEEHGLSDSIWREDWDRQCAFLDSVPAEDMPRQFGFGGVSNRRRYLRMRFRRSKNGDLLQFCNSTDIRSGSLNVLAREYLENLLYFGPEWGARCGRLTQTDLLSWPAR